MVSVKARNVALCLCAPDYDEQHERGRLFRACCNNYVTISGLLILFSGTRILLTTLPEGGWWKEKLLVFSPLPHKRGPSLSFV